MNLRLATENDLPQLKAVYNKITDNLNKNNICIWNESYPNDVFIEDIESEYLYILEDGGIIVSAFALVETDAGEDDMTWEKQNAKVLYLNRLGVNVDYLRQGIGEMMLKQSICIAGEKGAEYVRLFVVDFNTPAIELYEKCGFKKARGLYTKIIDDLVLTEYAYEIRTSM